MQRDITGFDAKAPPPKTEAFWAIVNANQPGEEAELADVLDSLGNPVIVTLDEIRDSAFALSNTELAYWLAERKNLRVIPHRLERCGYGAVRNPDAGNGLWPVRGKRQVVYGRKEKTGRELVAAVRQMKRETEKPVSIDFEPQEPSLRLGKDDIPF
jgi:hypothetical protein